MKPNEIRNLTTDEIVVEVAARRKKLQELRFVAVMGQNPNVKEIKAQKRHIARLLTIANEKAGL